MFFISELCLLVVLLITLIGNISPVNSINLTHDLSIVIVYSLSKEKCTTCDRFPLHYIQFSIEHLALIQQNCNIFFISDVSACAASCGKKTEDLLVIPAGVQYIDINKYINTDKNPKLAEFRQISKRAFMHEYLWLSSALRFFVLEEFMIEYNVSNVIHIEADNLIYGRFDEIYPTLKQSYPTLATTPLLLNAYTITASVFWIPTFMEMSNFNNFLTDCLGKDDQLYRNYLKWLRKFSCCRKGGIDPDKDGNGIYNRSVNEMSVLGYYKYLKPTLLQSFPLVPFYPFIKTRYMQDDLNSYRPGGNKVGQMLGYGVFDSGSYGQFIGGDSSSHDKRGFSEPKHIIGMGLRLSSCRPVVLCTNHGFSINSSTSIESEVKVIETNILSTDKSHKNSAENKDRFPTHGEFVPQFYDFERGFLAGQSRWRSYLEFHNNNSKYSRSRVNSHHKGRTLIAVKCTSSIAEFNKINDDALLRGHSFASPLLLSNSTNNETITTITPLWNLHVHSKLTWEFVTNTCYL